MTRRDTPPPPKPSDWDVELAFHEEMLVRRYMESGSSEADARARAAARIGAIHDVRRECRALSEEMETAPMTRPTWWHTVPQDFAYAVRVLLRTKLFTATALLTLAVGIGATTALFSVVNAVLLRSLPYPAADRTVMVFNAYAQQTLGETATSTPEFKDIATQTHVFDALAAMRPLDSALTDDCAPGAGCEPERVKAYVVSPNLFDLLGVSPSRGRGFTRADGVAGNVGGDRVVIISDGLWRRRYGADPSIVGRQIGLGGIARTVVGIMPAHVRFPDDPISYLKDPADIWIPMAWEDRKDERGNQYLVVLARVREGATPSDVAADLGAVSNTLKREYPDRYAEPKVHWRFGSRPLREVMVGDVRTALVVLFAAVGFVLLIACANVGNLILARGTTRRGEFAVRSALGASRWRLVQQLLIETLTLTTAGAIAGVGIAFAALRLLIAVNPGGIPRIATATIDVPVLVFAAVLALGSGVLVGIVPALRQTTAGPQSALGGNARGTDRVAPRRRLRGLLVVAEVTLAVTVLAGALLLVRSFIAMSQVPTGVALDSVAIAQVNVPRATYDTPAKVFAFHRALVGQFRAMPGVTRAAAVYPLPLSGEGWSGSVSVEGRPENDGTPEAHAEMAVATPGYFDTAGIPLLEGRDFADTDTPDVPRAVIVDELFARAYFPGQSAIGRRVSTSGDLEKAPQTIIGVVGHVRNDGPRGASEGQLYMAALQKSEVELFYLARTSGDPRTLTSGMRTALRRVDAKLPMTLLTTGRELVARFTARDRFSVLVFSIFGLIAVALAAIGLYGVLGFLVTQRTREIGIRLALGGRPGDVVRSIIGEGLTLTVAGLALGLGGAILLARSMTSLLFAIAPTDATTYLLVSAVMLLVSVAAALGPARRATQVNPVDVLRQ
jgi:putative ABC transport system permease protein